MIHGSFYRFVRLFLCVLAWKSRLWLNEKCSTDQIFFMTFQFQVSKVIFWHHFVSLHSFSISSSPIFRSFCKIANFMMSQLVLVLSNVGFLGVRNIVNFVCEQQKWVMDWKNDEWVRCQNLRIHYTFSTIMKCRDVGRTSSRTPLKKILF